MAKTTKQIVKELISDLTSRKGFDGIWSSIDEDIQLEIIEDWENIIVEGLSE